MQFIGVLLVCFVMIMLEGCDSARSDIENAVREKLDDPKSGKFADILLLQSGDAACIKWNKVDKFLRWGEWDSAYLTRKDTNDGWVVKGMNEATKRCSAESVQSFDLTNKSSKTSEES